MSSRGPLRIVVFSDGTGNSSAKAQKTNVWRLFQALDQTGTDQIARYDDGVGTSANKYLAALGGAFGWGLKRNVLDLYKFVCRNYQRGDRIYGFGFSRGAFTIRVLTGLIAREGLVVYRTEAELTRHAAAAYRSFRNKAFPSHSPIVWLSRRLRDAVLLVQNQVSRHRRYKQVEAATRQEGRHDVSIHFLGLWDTVEAYGVPNQELKRGIDWVLWPMLFGDRKLSPTVKRAVHALSLDDERTTFHPLMWDESNEPARRPGEPGRITQVWFAGVHSNVGGGYPEDQLSLVALDWILGHAVDNGLVFDQRSVSEFRSNQSAYAKMYDSRSGIASYYRYCPREVCCTEKAAPGGSLLGPIVHYSVLMRMACGSDSYVPIALPGVFRLWTPSGTVLDAQALADSVQEKDGLVTSGDPSIDLIVSKVVRSNHSQVELVWDTVFWCRCIYALTLTLTGLAVAFPLIGDTIAGGVMSLPWIGTWISKWLTPSDQVVHGPISAVVEGLDAFVPPYLAPWKSALVNHSLEFGVVLLGIVISFFASGTLKDRIHDRARIAWHLSHVENYRAWRQERRRGAVSAFLTGFILLGLGALIAYLLGAQPIGNGFMLTAGLVLVALGMSAVGHRNSTVTAPTNLRQTNALKIARWMRNNRVLRFLYSAISKKLVPIVFALLLFVSCLLGVNRVVFDTLDSAGLYCQGSHAPQPVEGSSSPRTMTLRTEQFCAASGWTVERGHRYRITLSTSAVDPWFDQAIPTDVFGFPSDSFRHWSALPLKRWWGQNWFKPIVRIGRRGNDEYVLDPLGEADKRERPVCVDALQPRPRLPVRAKIGADLKARLLECSTTPADRLILSSEFTARSAGELFLYVNDAELVIPGMYNFFYQNNSGSAEVTFERVKNSGNSELARSWSPRGVGSTEK